MPHRSDVSEDTARTTVSARGLNDGLYETDVNMIQGFDDGADPRSSVSTSTMVAPAPATDEPEYMDVGSIIPRTDTDDSNHHPARTLSNDDNYMEVWTKEEDQV